MIGGLSLLGVVVFLLFAEQCVARWRDQQIHKRIDALEKHEQETA